MATLYVSDELFERLKAELAGRPAPKPTFQNYVAWLLETALCEVTAGDKPKVAK